ncbi:class II glutamine amidotransferase [Marinomonas mediterranea]|uniref:Glutamine amidotransferase class-II n=1 Tax=Marinomonas mediterranea (strain ATCC 700492 / JCM 21426 / NBRC 103028 / MMB-1) TaxID=717774 RepID=F2K265_MARM1|nr:class II glutamine amidotransferase [Marinomonas mediterranea]ADZ91143.1 glutamine amidotransferase class-II [Marinomonas mediterranea MMB-1]WCN09119.1 class II glutamine amidotransferase [Marinomonas mediterranea]WCN17274.1 class II glutamine amidotransferase [Marinomonas mediterranea MMB-1]
MCRWMAYKGQSVYLESLLFEPDHSLIHQSLSARKSEVTVNADGFGLGWYDEREEPGLYHEILPAWSDCNLKSLARHIKSPLFFAHVRASTGTSTNRSNCHPFAYKEWLFMHNGQIGEYDELKWMLDRAIPEHLYGHRRGATDSEAIFLLLLSNGLESNPEGAVEKTLTQIRNMMIEKNIEEPLRFTSVFSNGKDMWAVRYSSDEQAPSLYIKNFDNHLVIGSEPLELSGDGWELIPPSSLIKIDGLGYQRTELNVEI